MPITSAANTAVRRSKWAATAASIWIQCVAGASYCFGVYSPLLKSSQGYDQSTLDSVAFFKDVGANVGVLSGLLISSPVASRRRWVVLAAGAAQGFAGYLMMWLSVIGAVPRPPPIIMGLYLLLAAHAQTFFNTGNVVTAVENFQENRGTVIGIMKGFLGLSGAILIQMHQTILNGNPRSFLLMLALLPTLLTLSLMWFVEVHHKKEGSEKKFLDAFSLIAVAVAFYIMVVIIGELVVTMRSVGILAFVALFVLLLSPAVVVVMAQMKKSKNLESCSNVRIRLIYDNKESVVLEQKECDLLEEESTCKYRDYISPRRLPSETVQGPFSQDLILLPRGGNFSLWQAMSTLDFWLLFLAMACGMGSGLATVNNISQIGGSLGYTSLQISTLVSLWSIWNFLGRFGAGYISDYFLRLRGCARPLFIAITLAIMSLGHAAISSGLPGSLYIGSVLVGVCYGSQWALMPSITSEIFGLRDFGTIFNTIAIASPFGSYILSVKVVGYIYDMESSGLQSCTGRQCFMLSFLIMAAVSLTGFAIAMALFYRTRKFYEQVIFAKLQASVVE